MDKAKKKRDSNVASILSEYPLEVYPNWTICPERYYVEAPVDRWGEWAFHVRSHITSLILAGNPAIEFVQRFECPAFTKLAYFFSFCGLEEVFFLLIASLIWCIDAKLGRLLAMLLSAGFFVCSTMKVYLALPRPPAPPAKRLMMGTAFPWFIWMYASSHYELSFANSLLLLSTVFISVALHQCKPRVLLSAVASLENAVDDSRCGEVLLSSPPLSLSFLLDALFPTVSIRAGTASSTPIVVSSPTAASGNSGVIWSRVYLGVHSPCDVVGGWVMGVLLLFVFSGFAEHIHSFYVNSSLSSSYSLLHFSLVALLALSVHPRGWPETQSFSEVMCVLPGALIGIWSSRVLCLGGNSPPLSLSETLSDAPFYAHLLRIVFGCATVAVVRLVVKALATTWVRAVYDLLGLPRYSYSAHCKRLGSWQPTKRYTTRLRFRPIPGEKRVNWELVPYDVDLPVKFVVYTCVGFLVAEGCPFLFSLLQI